MDADGHSVLPPPPRYPSSGPYHPGGLSGIVPLIETNNTLSNPTGPEWQFLVGEGEPPLKRCAVPPSRGLTLPRKELTS